ncbi:MAG TPA: IS701 family transposase [Ktedonobacteraceae bacterium]|nr:IS701 family transposase [Ktedonobacteraceae bacterium]
MKQPQQITPVGTKITFVDVWKWGQELRRLHARIAARFARPEPRRRALAYLQGIVSSVERKNGWQLAEHAGEARPDGKQRLLSSASWDADLVRDDLRTYILEQLGDPQAILVIDETSFPKRGKKSAGVKKQYCGRTGQVENCQVGVFLSYVSAQGHSLIDRELYLPKDWIDDPGRCTEAGIPEEVGFQTKCELAQQMIERLWKAQIPFAWVVADSVYGGNLDLRTWLEAHQYSYVLAVACDEPVGIQTASGRKQMTVAEAEALLLHADDWQRLSMSEGTKGPRLFDWAVIPILHQWEDDGRHFLLVRRCLDDPSEKAYYFVFAPPGTQLPEMVKALGARWSIEEDFETGKAMGLSDYEVRCWTAWYRHITLVMIVEACLAGICAAARSPTTEPPSDEGTPPTCPLLPLTLPEVRHLLAHLLWPPPRSANLLLAWSWWRRCHQSRASFFHTKRRCAAG